MTPDHDRTSPPPGSARRSQAEPPTASAQTGSGLGTASLAAVGAVEAFQRALTAAPPAAEFDPPPGFEWEKELGAGGMGVVYRARQLGLNRPVALKLVKGVTAIDAKALIRFLAEAEVVAAIRHPNVVEVYQYGEHGGRPYMALEYCPGGDLTTLTKSTPTRDPAWFRRMADLMAKVAGGVNAAHAQGVVHRDLKPANVLLTADGTPKVADFGLAKRGIDTDLTKTDAIMGTPAYMAPEQAGGGTKFVGPEADVWALGVMLYELCCGQRPIDTSGPVLDAIARVAKGEVSQLSTRTPTDLALIVHKCLSPDPGDRYPTAGALATDLRCWLDGEPITARRAGVSEQAVKWAKRNKKLAGMGLAMMLTMVTATCVSLGFGLEASQQAGRANQKQTEAEGAAVQATEEKNNALSARAETQLALAEALLGPMSAEPSDWKLSEPEQDVLWRLASMRDKPIGPLCIEVALRTPLTVKQFRGRAAYLDHAVVGLNFDRRRRVDELLAATLRDDQVPNGLKRNVTLAAVDVQTLLPAKVVTDVLVPMLEAEVDADWCSTRDRGSSAGLVTGGG